MAAAEAEAERVTAMALYLGFSEADEALLWIAREALAAPLPAGWAAATDASGNVYYWHAADGVTSWESPNDEHYRRLYRRHARGPQPPPPPPAPPRGPARPSGGRSSARVARVREPSDERATRAAAEAAVAAALARRASNPAERAALPAAGRRRPPPRASPAAGAGAWPAPPARGEPPRRAAAVAPPSAPAVSAAANAVRWPRSPPPAPALSAAPPPGGVAASSAQLAFWSELLPQLVPAGEGLAPEWQQRLLTKLRQQMARAQGRPLSARHERGPRARDTARPAAAGAPRPWSATAAPPATGGAAGSDGGGGGAVDAETMASLRARLAANHAPPAVADASRDAADAARGPREAAWRSLCQLALAPPADAADAAPPTPRDGASLSGAARQRLSELRERVRACEDRVRSDALEAGALAEQMAAAHADERVALAELGQRRRAEGVAREQWGPGAASLARGRLQHATQRLAESDLATAALRALVCGLRSERRQFRSQLDAQAASLRKMDEDISFLAAYVEAGVDARDRIARSLLKHAQESLEESHLRLAVGVGLQGAVAHLHETSLSLEAEATDAAEAQTLACAQRSRDVARAGERRRARHGYLRAKTEGWAAEFEMLAALLPQARATRLQTHALPSPLVAPPAALRRADAQASGRAGDGAAGVAAAAAATAEGQLGVGALAAHVLGSLRLLELRNGSLVSFIDRQALKTNEVAAECAALAALLERKEAAKVSAAARTSGRLARALAAGRPAPSAAERALLDAAAHGDADGALDGDADGALDGDADGALAGALAGARVVAAESSLAQVECLCEPVDAQLRAVCRAVYALTLAVQAPVPDELAFAGCRPGTLLPFCALLDARLDALWARAQTISRHGSERRRAAAATIDAAATAQPLVAARRALGGARRTTDAAALDASEAVTRAEVAAATQLLLLPDVLGHWLGHASSKAHAASTTADPHGLHPHELAELGRESAPPLVRPPGPAQVAARIDSALLKRHMTQLLVVKEQDDLDLEDGLPDDRIVDRDSSQPPSAKLHAYVDLTLARAVAESADVSREAASERKARAWSPNARKAARQRRPTIPLSPVRPRGARAFATGGGAGPHDDDATTTTPIDEPDTYDARER